ncbi:MAG: uncharacterized protein QG670_1282 [Thermoproteota archaeon]|nr:uncharacterized protein [Thermoproteota archaeon]
MDKQARLEVYFDMYRDSRGEWRWRLKSSNDHIIVNSGEGYKEKKSCEDGIVLAKKNVAMAKIWKQMSRSKKSSSFF